MDSLHRSKHLWCLKRCKEASIDRSKTFYLGAVAKQNLLCCPGFYLLLIVTEGEEASKQRLPYACLLSIKGAYYVANKQASISCLLRISKR
jgi:hypothetical protein